MFRVQPNNPFKGPHQQSKTIFGDALPTNTKAAMIMIHGRGATAESILTLANEFNSSELYLAAPQAYQSQWYPYSFLAPIERNEPGLSSGLQVIYHTICDLIQKGFKKEKILLLGFSQGACLASEYVARHPDRYGGLITLSGGLIGDKISINHYSGSLYNTPVFLGCSNVDPHIPKERVDETETILKNLEADVTKKIYSGLGHTVNSDELSHINRIIKQVTNS